MPSSSLATLLLLVQCCLANIPTTNTTVVSGWVKEPDERGTFSILSSCLLTLSLCVYTAVHLNVRPKEKGETHSWLEMSKWVTFGVLAPELLVFIAWRQYASAMNLDRTVKQMKELQTTSKHVAEQNPPGHRVQPEASQDEQYSLCNPWTMRHSFYANMGGFVFDFEEDGDISEDQRFAPKNPRLTLTPRGMALLIRCGYLPRISEKDILDKSKTDNVSRLLAILQALWMLSQILGRLAVQLPVTLLEVNTLAHVVCALIMYALWWNKPKAVNEPTRLRGDWAASICAYMYMSSQLSGWRRQRPGILKKYWKDPEMSVLAFYPPASGSTQSQTGVDIVLQSSQSEDQGTGSPGDPHRSARVQYGTLSPRPVEALAEEEQLDGLDMYKNLGLRLENSKEYRAQRWKLAAKAMSTHPAIASRVKVRTIRTRTLSHVARSHDQREESSIDSSIGGSTSVTYNEPLTEELVDSAIGNWARENLLRNMSGFVMGMTLWSASMAYGGIHVAAWNSFFPTPVERLLWRCSAICIAASGLVWILINMSAHSNPMIKAYWKSVAALRADMVSLIGLGGLATLCGLAYVLARLYIIVESLISLRTLPQKTFETMQWSQLMPHL